MRVPGTSLIGGMVNGYSRSVLFRKNLTQKYATTINATQPNKSKPIMRNPLYQ